MIRSRYLYLAIFLNLLSLEAQANAIWPMWGFVNQYENYFFNFWSLIIASLFLESEILSRFTKISRRKSYQSILLANIVSTIVGFFVFKFIPIDKALIDAGIISLGNLYTIQYKVFLFLLFLLISFISEYLVVKLLIKNVRRKKLLGIIFTANLLSNLAFWLTSL